MKTGRTRAGWQTGPQWYAQGPIEHDGWTLADTRRLIGVLALGLVFAATLIGAMAVAS